MFTKLDMVDNQPVLTNFIEWCHDDVIGDVTVDRFRLEFSIFRACKYYNLRNFNPMLTKLDTVDYQLVLINYIEWCLDDVTSEYFLANVIISLFQLVSTITPLFIIGPWWNVVGLLVDGQWRTHQYDVISDVTIQYFSVNNKPFSAYSHNYSTIYYKALMKRGRIVGWWSMKSPSVWHHQWRHRVLSYAWHLLHECNILFQIQQLHIAEGSRRSYTGSGWR